MKTRILVVDDDIEFTRLLKRRLEAEGYYEVGAEHDASRAVPAARLFGPDLVLLDEVMPDVEGSEVAFKFKHDRFLHDVPVLFLTAIVSSEDAIGGAYCSGGQTFLPKSITTGQLIDFIEHQLRSAKQGVALSA